MSWTTNARPGCLRQRGNNEAKSAGADTLAVRTDIRDPAAVDSAFSEIEHALGPVELLVNNAGTTEDGLVARMSDAQWQSVIDTNLTGAFHTIRRAAPKMMRARWGRIVNISSVSAHRGGPGQANYAAAKAGLLGLTRSIARELAPRNVTCNVVAPGPIVTSMTEGLSDEWQVKAEEAVPLGRFGRPDEVSAVASQDDAVRMTGHQWSRRKFGRLYAGSAVFLCECDFHDSSLELVACRC